MNNDNAYALISAICNEDIKTNDILREFGLINNKNYMNAKKVTLEQIKTIRSFMNILGYEIDSIQYDLGMDFNKLSDLTYKEAEKIIDFYSPDCAALM
jgi:hypothetical protein